MTRVQCSRPVVADTIAALQRGGRAGEERVVTALVTGDKLSSAYLHKAQVVQAIRR